MFFVTLVHFLYVSEASVTDFLVSIAPLVLDTVLDVGCEIHKA